MNRLSALAGGNGIGSGYRSNYQIFQSPGYVVVYQELIHEPRIIPLDDRPHLPRENLHLTERYTLVDADTIDYELTVHDPQTFTRPWTV